ncbi:outer membrane protein [Ancylobacter terrae]|uniref:outer membrane protein n=1 Tax=Ancylobacter sp. sgz301288 TaxID=3342077 RepID=UPI00385C7594
MSYPVKAPPVVVAPAFTWTGFYIGANVGYGWGEVGDSGKWQKYLDWYYDYDCNCEVPTVKAAASDYYGYYVYDYGFNGTGKQEPDGWFGGAQIGYNYQFSNNVVLGFEADVQFADMKDSATYWADEYFVPYGGGEMAALDAAGYYTGYSEYGLINTKIETFGTVRARLGYAFDRFLPYVTGGLAWANVKVNEAVTFTYDDVAYGSAAFSASDTLWGWTLGGGVEYALTDNWTVKVEYLYADLGSIDYHPNYDVYENWRGDFDVTMQTLKFGVNYKF